MAEILISLMGCWKRYVPGLDKCAIAHFINGKLSGHNTGVKVEKTETIKCLEPGQVYRYLGADESNGIQHSTMRERLRRENFPRV